MKLRDVASQISVEGGIRTENRLLFASIDSTNKVGKRIASLYQRNGEDLSPTLLMALEQTEGRGRLGNRWLSPLGGIYVSIVLPIRNQDSLSTLPMRVATVLCRELDTLLASQCRVKWPNDLMVNGRKVGGILIETVGSGENLVAVVGFGINYSAALPDLREMATSVVQEAADAPPLTEVAVQMIQVLETDLLSACCSPEIVEEYSIWSLHDVGEEIACRTVTGLHQGEFLGFDSRGFLRILTGDGEHLIPAGEIIERASVGHHES